MFGKYSCAPSTPRSPRALTPVPSRYGLLISRCTSDAGSRSTYSRAAVAPNRCKRFDCGLAAILLRACAPGARGTPAARIPLLIVSSCASWPIMPRPASASALPVDMRGTSPTIGNGASVRTVFSSPFSPMTLRFVPVNIGSKPSRGPRGSIDVMWSM